MNPATVYLSKWPKSRDTHKTMRKALDLVVQVLVLDDRWATNQYAVDTFPWHELRHETTTAIPALLAERTNRNGDEISVSTINKSLVALRGVLESAWRSGQIPDEDYRKIKIKNARGKSAEVGRALSAKEMDAILEALSKIPPDEAAMIALMCACGLRRIELVRLRREDFDQVSNRLVAKGKGDKPRSIPIAPRWLPFIHSWWDALPPKVAVFTGFNGKAMSRRTVSYIIEQFCKDAVLPRFTPHDLRRTFATRVCENSDISIAAKLLGHYSVNTTTIYDKRGEKAEAAAVKGI